MEAEPQLFDNIEDIVRHIDRSGRWQWWTMIRCCLIVTGISTVIYAQSIFFTGKLQHECVLYDDGTDAASAYSTFIDSANNVQNLTLESIKCALPSKAGGAKCVKWQYSSPYYDFTMMKEYDLVCGRSFWLPTFQSSVVWGQLIGLPFWGAVADRYGRLSTLRFTYGIFLLTSLAMAFVRPLFLMIGLRSFFGFILSASWNPCFVICMELAVPELRNSIGVYVGSGWPVGAMITACLAYFIRNYRHLSLATLAVAVLCAPVVLLMEESPRWLVMHKRFDQAKKLLGRHAKHNNVALPEGTEFLQRIHRKRMEQDTANKQSQLSQIVRLLTERRLRLRTFVLVIAWIGVAFVFHGLMYYGTGSLPFSPMLTLGVLSFLRTVGQPLYVLISNWFGVRDGMVYGLAVTAVAMIVLAFIPMRSTTVLSILYAALYLTAFIAIDYCLTVIYILTGELYPTVLRQSSLGFFSMTARLGNVGAPYVATLLAQYWLPLPAFIFGIACIVATIGSLALPRADDAMLPETVTEAELIQNDERLESNMTPRVSFTKRGSVLRADSRKFTG